MTGRQQELDEMNAKNRSRQNNRKVYGFSNKKEEQKKQEKTPIDYSDFPKFIEHIKNTKTKKNKMDLMLEFINQEAKDINETIE